MTDSWRAYAPRFAVGTLVSALFLWLVLRSVPLDAIVTALGTTRPGPVALATLLMAPAVLIRGERWRVLTDPAGTVVPRSIAERTTLAGLTLNIVLPARLGELARVLLLHRLCGVSRMLGLAATAAERVLDLAALALLVLLVAPGFPDSGTTKALIGASLVICGATAALVLAMHLWSDWLRRVTSMLVARISRVAERADELAGYLMAGLASLRGGRMLARVLSLSIGSWIVLALVDLAALRSVLPDLPWHAAVAVLVATNVALAVPSTAAGLGVFEAAGVAALGAYGVHGAPAVSAILVVHAVNTLPVLAVGGPMMLVNWVRGTTTTPVGRPAE